MLPFTRDGFLDVFAAYNQAVWPAQPVAYLLGIAALAALVRREASARRLALWIVAAMWLWTGLVYHWLFFSEINRAAMLFGFLFVLQAGLLGLVAGRPDLRFSFRWRAGPAAVVGGALIAYAVLLYPLLDLIQGHWPRMPPFGISPCPVTLFTLGFLLLARPRPPWWLWAIPVTWSLIGGTAAFLLGMPQDWVLLLAGPAALLLAFGRLSHRTGGSRASR